MPVDKFGHEFKQRTTTVQSEGGIGLSFVNNTYLRLDGENDVTGNLNMDLNKIENLGEPTNPRDATNKEYVDKTKGKGIIGEVKDETATLKGNLDFKDQYRIKNLPDPVDEKDGVNREYVEEQINFNSAFKKRDVGGYEAKGFLFIRKNKILGLREPLQDGEAANKKYVDDKIHSLFLDDNDNMAFGSNVDMEGNKILNLPEPVEDHEPSTKKYVDDLHTEHVDQKGNVKFGKNINLDNKRIFGMKDPIKPKEGANKKYVDETITRKIQEEKDTFLPQDPATKHYVDEAIRKIAGGDILVSKEGVFIKENGHYRATAPLDIDNQKMENVGFPLNEKDAVNKKYVDEMAKFLTLNDPLIRENGGYNIDNAYLNMNFNNIRNIGKPEGNADATPRFFVENIVKSSEEKVKKEIKHLIVANASYHGDLIKGDYQFTWGGQSMNSYKELDIFNGFVVPSSGYIKKFVVFSTGIKLNGSKDIDYDELINEIGLNKPFPVFTLVLIKYGEILTTVDIGTLYYFFNNYFIANSIGEVFKFNPNFDEKTLRTIKAKDMINIKSELYTKRISGNRFSFLKHIFPYSIEEDDEFHTYNASILIELDPIDD